MCAPYTSKVLHFKFDGAPYQLRSEFFGLFKPRHMAAVLEHHQSRVGNARMQTLRDRHWADPVMPPNRDQYGRAHLIKQRCLVACSSLVCSVLCGKSVQRDLPDQQLLLG